MHLILGKQLVQNSGDCIISLSLSLGQDCSRFPMERRGRYGLGAALVTSRSLVLLYHQCDCPEKGRWPNLVSASCILLWWQTKLEQRVRDTQKGEVLHFRGCCGEGKQKSNAIAFSSKMKAIQFSWIVTGKKPCYYKGLYLLKARRDAQQSWVVPE